jgi:hypothetical protein
MNEKLLAVSALLVQGGALLDSHNCFINFLQLSNVKLTPDGSTPVGRQVTVFQQHSE